LDVDLLDEVVQVSIKSLLITLSLNWTYIIICLSCSPGISFFNVQESVHPENYPKSHSRFDLGWTLSMEHIFFLWPCMHVFTRFMIPTQSGYATPTTLILD
jgi:hypothetical protein